MQLTKMERSFVQAYERRTDRFVSRRGYALSWVGLPVVVVGVVRYLIHKTDGGDLPFASYIPGELAWGVAIMAIGWLGFHVRVIGKLKRLLDAAE